MANNRVEAQGQIADAPLAQDDGEVINAAIPAAVTGDWKRRLKPEYCVRVVAKITDTLARHIPFNGAEGLEDLRIIAIRFEDKMFTSATTQYDYVWKISMKMKALEARYVANGEQNPSDEGADDGGEVIN